MAADGDVRTDDEDSAFFAQDYSRDLGFTIRDHPGGPDFHTEFERLGGAEVLGPPVSRPWLDPDGYAYQLTRVAMLQWSPHDGRTRVANLFDTLHERGHDAAVQAHGYPSHQADDDATFREAVDATLSWLTDPPIEAAFYANPVAPGNRWASIEVFGLPRSLPTQIGELVVQRFQRVAFGYVPAPTPDGTPPTAILFPSGSLFGDLVLAGTPQLQPHPPGDSAIVSAAQASAIDDSEPAPLPSSPLGDYDAGDPEILQALALLENVPVNAEALRLASERQVTIRFENLPAPHVAVFRAPATIALSPRLRSEDRRVLASLLAHELLHVADYARGSIGTTAAACIDAEVRGLVREGQSWESLTGPAGLQAADTAFELAENRRLSVVQRGLTAVRLHIESLYGAACDSWAAAHA